MRSMHDFVNIKDRLQQKEVSVSTITSSGIDDFLDLILEHMVQVRALIKKNKRFKDNLLRVLTFILMKTPSKKEGSFGVKYMPINPAEK